MRSVCRRAACTSRTARTTRGLRRADGCSASRCLRFVLWVCLDDRCLYGGLTLFCGLRWHGATKRFSSQKFLVERVVQPQERSTTAPCTVSWTDSALYVLCKVCACGGFWLWCKRQSVTLARRHEEVPLAMPGASFCRRVKVTFCSFAPESGAGCKKTQILC